MACDICSELLMTGSDAFFHVTAAGHRLRARWFGLPGARAIVLLHQGLGSITQWRDFPPRLAGATGLPVLAYDRYGHGGSEGLDAPRSVDFLEREARVALPELLAACAIAEPVLYGHSDGGTIALIHSAAFPETRCAVISEAAHVFNEAHDVAGFAELIASFEAGELRSRLERHHGANTEAMFREWVAIWRCAAMSTWRITESLGRIRAPLLVIQGENDTHGSRAQVDAIASGVAGPVETLIIARCGHSPHLEASDAVLARVVPFLRRALSDG